MPNNKILSEYIEEIEASCKECIEEVSEILSQKKYSMATYFMAITNLYFKTLEFMVEQDPSSRKHMVDFHNKCTQQFLETTLKDKESK